MKKDKEITLPIKDEITPNTEEKEAIVAEEEVCMDEYVEFDEALTPE